MIRKPGQFSSENQRPIKYPLQVVYFVSVKPMNCHLEKYGFKEREQRGAREKCSGTFDNLLIDRMVCQDSQWGKRNLSMAWVDVRIAFDMVDHIWLGEMFELHRFPSVVGSGNTAIEQ